MHEFDNDGHKRVVEARIALILGSPFFGQLATKLKTIDATKWCPTAATDGKHLYYNRDFIANLDNAEMLFLMCHEVFHVCYDHMGRINGREPKLWNIASDFVINGEIVEQGIGKIIYRKGVVEPCYDKKYDGLISEEVYELLKKEQEKNGDKFNELGFDYHIDPNMQTDPTGENGPVPMTDEQKKMLREEIKQEIIRASKSAGNSTPESIKRMVNELTDPKVDWRQFLTNEIVSIMKNDYSFTKPNKKTWACGGVILPGMPNDFKADIAVAIDTSGSISNEMIREFLSEVRGIMEQFKDFDLQLWCFDTDIHAYHKFTPENLHDIDSYVGGGYGGTTFEVNWEFMKENEIEPSRFVMFTDGYPCGGWGDEDYCETVFLIHGYKGDAPFGVSCHYDQL